MLSTSATLCLPAAVKSRQYIVHVHTCLIEKLELLVVKLCDVFLAFFLVQLLCNKWIDLHFLNCNHHCSHKFDVSLSKFLGLLFFF